MNDLTKGSVTGHLLKTTSFMLVTMVFQTLYFLIDLYWVGRLGTQSVAAVGIAGNLTFFVLALSQMLGVGTTTLVSHAAGRRDHEAALLMFNQSQVLSLLTGLLFLIVGLALTPVYARSMSPDPDTTRQANEYLLWFIPAMALQFALVAMGSALRGIGNFKPGMVVSTTTVIINIILAPFLIFGWGTGYAFGVAGAAVSSLVAVAVGVVWLSAYFVKKDAYLRFVFADWKPKLELWKKMLTIGLPAGFEFALTAVNLIIVYAITKPFGAAAQAGVGIGMRVLQSGFMPVVALGFSVAPVAGQNFGARQAQRVKDTFRDGAILAAVAMFLFGILCHVIPEVLVGIFSSDPEVIAIGTEYLQIVSWSFVGSGVVFVASSMFQAMGNTIPALVASSARMIVFAVPAFMMTGIDGFHLRWIWYLSVAAVVFQLVLSLGLLRMEFRKRLQFEPVEEAPVPAATQ